MVLSLGSATHMVHHIFPKKWLRLGSRQQDRASACDEDDARSVDPKLDALAMRSTRGIFACGFVRSILVLGYGCLRGLLFYLQLTIRLQKVCSSMLG